MVSNNELRKISFYLKPDQVPADKVASDIFDSLPYKERGKAMRAALLAGIALMKQEQRIPFLISEFLNENTTINDIKKLIKSVSSKEDEENFEISQLLKKLISVIKSSSFEMGIIQNECTDEANNNTTRKNAKNLFPE
ncbi:plasmid stabilization protein [Candidatus Regiella insecticola]|uniref:Plasmid stabilization protein n=1 Tax=Candidatus Regiella insecticola TaxID=138073 RepID=A0A6L2ZRW5_9ENTR|nr:plasmid stabilization protein [Candidatus Regiella insecticola]